ncbi:hypothetical protein LWI29_013867 [Acer saccharum]|uniref:Uncharacterized protein n=1 Tax=Acer saccharum TaxID=4024 RepID=A0AA39SSD9_ACESA|nr:hypothetical protein LWI29_013867 [Acer saccharum]
MEKEKADGGGALLDGFSPVSSTRIEWKSRKRSASGMNFYKVIEDAANETPTKQEETPNEEKEMEPVSVTELSERRKALFEPLEPANGRILSAESLLPPQTDSSHYPKGWLLGRAEASEM